jgi:DEAD/DEAH box helicase
VFFVEGASMPSNAAHPQGSGKTLAFGLPIIQQLLAEGSGEAGGHAPRTATPPSPLRGLILLPTRELALQVSCGFFPCTCESTETLPFTFQQRAKKRSMGGWTQPCGQAWHTTPAACVGEPKAADIEDPSLQVEQHLRAVAGRCGIGTAAIVGGLSALKQVEMMQDHSLL